MILPLSPLLQTSEIREKLGEVRNTKHQQQVYDVRSSSAGHSGDIQIIDDIMAVLVDPQLYNAMHDKGIGNHTITDNLRKLGVITNQEATAIAIQLRPKSKKPSLSPKIT